MEGKRMQTPLQITFHDVPHSDAMEAHIREKAAKLESLFSPIMACHVKVELPHKHKHQGRNFRVNLDLRVPGTEIVVNHHEHEDAYVALRDAFDAAKRQLEEHHQKVRSSVKHQLGGRAMAAELLAAEASDEGA
jgi:ribosomal subunit interface protein